jgi:transcriptional regulator GlxA family with amidase domain
MSFFDRILRWRYKAKKRGENPVHGRRKMKTSKKPAQSILQADLSQETQTICVEKHYSVAELAQLWQLSRKTIRRMFENEPGVIVWGVAESRFKRRYRTLRIPATVVLRVHRQLRAAG